MIYPNTIERLHGLGVLDRVMAHRPPPLYTAWHHRNRMFVAPHTPDHGRDWAICVRRSTLDAILAQRAAECGVEVRLGTTVTGLAGSGREDDPVAGLTCFGDGEVREIEAGIVAGADGVNSGVARMVGAGRDGVMPSKTMLYYAYWTGADARNTQDFFFEPPWVCAHFPADDGHHVITMNGPLEAKASIDDLEAFYLEKIRSIPLLWGRLSGAAKVSRVKGSRRLDGFYRRHTGPGWLLTGDAAHFKHPASRSGYRRCPPRRGGHRGRHLRRHLAGELPGLAPAGLARPLRVLRVPGRRADRRGDAARARRRDPTIPWRPAPSSTSGSRKIAPWDAMALVPAMLEAAGPTPDAVLAKYEAATLRMAS